MNKKFLFLFVMILLAGGIFYRENTAHPAPTIQPLFFEEQEINNPQHQVGKIMVEELAVDGLAIWGDYNIVPKKLSEWEKSTRSSFDVLINAAYFLEDYTPAGYLIFDGEEISTKKFDYDKSGALIVSNKGIDIRDMSQKPIAEDEKVELLVQSFPFLIKDGEGAIKEDSGKVAWRTAIGMNAKRDTVYIFSLTDRQISLYEFMKEIEAFPYDLDMVLNLDGGPSSGMITSTLTKDSKVPVSSVLLFKQLDQLK